MKILLSFILAFSAQAFTINANIPIRFADPEIRVHVADNACSNITDSADEIMDMVEIAASNYWNKISTSSLHLKGGNIQTVDSAYTTNGICNAGSAGCSTQVPDTNRDILIVCNGNTDVFTSVGILAVTLPNNLSGATIVGSVIGINDISGTKYNEQTRAQKIALFAHEIGHAFGLGHSKLEDSLMYFRNLTGRETIGEDDWDGATYLYPKEQIPMCGTIEQIDKQIDDKLEGTNLSEQSPAKPSGGFFIGAIMLLLSLIITRFTNQEKIC
ncbi:metallopeptidase family M84 [Halobacteriovorax sp. BALOs_7]|uniref:matrixin family metalloprotease n=1 Tax=unclassified Halobacteriovorax TaxID=2639665 RepID=UPI000EA3F86F|nr:matrixin family metalloprotease [Halobacteriovorax sp. BALOs_7]AYF44350.1 metallopeptidase family M84 [Halobacteriovorax sp. BALOs_7]